MTDTVPPALRDYLVKQPGRCGTCCWHIDKQGHAPHCGDFLRDEAFAHLDQAPAAGDENALLRRAILALGGRKLEFTADDLPHEIRMTTNPNRRGRVFAALVASHELRVIGETKSANPKAHGKSVNVYRLGHT
jgi:hypothetical protein